MEKEHYLAIVYVLLLIAVSAWIFNHVNPYLGIAIGVVVGYLIIDKAFK